MLGHVHDGIHGNLGVGLHQAVDKDRGDGGISRASHSSQWGFRGLEWRTQPWEQLRVFSGHFPEPTHVPSLLSPPDLLQHIIPGDVFDVLVHHGANALLLRQLLLQPLHQVLVAVPQVALPKCHSSACAPALYTSHIHPRVPGVAHLPGDPQKHTQQPAQGQRLIISFASCYKCDGRRCLVGAAGKELSQINPSFPVISSLNSDGMWLT